MRKKEFEINYGEKGSGAVKYARKNGYVYRAQIWGLSISKIVRCVWSATLGGASYAVYAFAQELQKDRELEVFVNWVVKQLGL